MQHNSANITFKNIADFYFAVILDDIKLFKNEWSCNKVGLYTSSQ